MSLYTYIIVYTNDMPFIVSDQLGFIASSQGTDVITHQLDDGLWNEKNDACSGMQRSKLYIFYSSAVENVPQYAKVELVG